MSLKNKLLIAGAAASMTLTGCLESTKPAAPIAPTPVVIQERPFRDYTALTTVYRTEKGKYSLSERNLSLGEKQIPYTVLGIGNKSYILNQNGDLVRVIVEGDVVGSVGSALNKVEGWFVDPLTGKAIELNPVEPKGNIDTSEPNQP